MRILLVVLLTACSAQHTPESELQARLKYSPGDCMRICPGTGKSIVPVEPQSENILEDCCKDEQGIGWGSCAWNLCGVDETCRKESDARVLSGPNCGGDGWKPCARL